MTAELIRGEDVAESVLDPIRRKIRSLVQKPGLALVLVGDDPASHIYVGMKEKKCNELGFYVEKHVLDGATSQQNVVRLVNDMNQKPEIHGILVQLPLPEHLDEQIVIDAMKPEKDVDGFTRSNLGALMSGDPRFAAATAAGILKLIESTDEPIEGKQAVIIGRSNVVGKPAALLLLGANATVTLCHSRTRDLGAVTRQADILIAAAGRPRLVTADMIKPGAIVIDAGTNRVDGHVVGDVDFDDARQVAGYITPVPGGVGPMTIAMLLENTMKAMELQNAG